nr:hypothetical protein [Tanacetum cinerariifolium]
MGDKHLDTVPATESDEFKKSSVEKLVPNPSESEGENGCDLPACFTTFSNILFDAEYEFDSVDNQPLHNEDFPKEIFSNPLFEEEISSIKKNQHHFNAESDLVESMLKHDSSIILSFLKIDSLLDEFTGELTLLKSIPPGIDETDCHPENEIRLSQRLLTPVKILYKVLHKLTTNVVTGVIPICYDDEDDEESSTPLRDIIIFELNPCIAITPVLSKETKDSLIMKDEHLDTILEKESDEFIKSSVENLVQNPSEFEDEHELMTSHFLMRTPKEIYSNPLFDEEIISIKIDMRHFNAESDLIKSLLNQDSSIISSSKIDSFLDEFAGELIFLKSIPPGIDEADCDPEEEIRLIEKLLYDNSSPRPPE